jgi:predicted N-acetyltransferase YhbS
MQYLIRPETASDLDQISNVTRQAFDSSAEVTMIEKLRKGIDFLLQLSLVALKGHQVLGHILFSPIRIVSENGDRTMSLALAPLSVLPEFQRKGVGSALILQGLHTAKDLSYSSVIVLGHADYYPRFGFKPASHWNITCPFPSPDEAFMALELLPHVLDGVDGVVEYAPAFYELE